MLKDHAPENFGILRHIAINLLKRENSIKRGIQTKRMGAAWDKISSLSSESARRLISTCDCIAHTIVE